MTAFADMISDGFAEMKAAVGGASITVATLPLVTGITCILSPVDKAEELRETGFMPQYTALAELTRADAASLGLSNFASLERPLCTIGGLAYKIVGISDDPHEPCVRLQLKPDRA